jgi:acetyl esterase/lipase
MATPSIFAYKEIGDVSLNIHLFQPDEKDFPKPRPAIVFFFCGGWNGFDASKFYPQSSYLIQRGLACFNAEVRVEQVHGTTPMECVIDAKSAIRYVRAHAEEYGIDPERIAAGGGSAAGHVTACCGIIEGFDQENEDLSVRSRPDAMVLFNPAVDTTTLQRRIDRFGGLEQARSLSPIHHIKPGNPPAIVMHGHADETVLVDQAVRFEKAMTEAGNRCDLRLYDDQGHGFFNYFEGDNPMFTETLKETDIFLTSLGYLEGDEFVEKFVYTPPE